MNTDLTLNDNSEIYQVLDDLVTKQSRLQVFEQILRNGPIRNMEIAERVDCTEGTISNSFNDLQKHGLAERTQDKKYQPTPAGLCLGSQMIEGVSKAASVQELMPFLSQVSHLADSGFERIVHEIDDPAIFSYSSKMAALPEYNQLINDATELREIVPFRTAEGRTIRDRLMENELEGEFIIQTERKNEMLQAEREDEKTSDSPDRKLLEDLQKEANEVKHHEPVPDFMISIFEGVENKDKVVLFMSFDDEYVLVRTDNLVVWNWADDLFKKYINKSDPINLEG